MNPTEIVFHSKSPEQTAQLGKELAPFLGEGDIIAFDGELGAGKTCLIRGIARGLGIAENITSSSFVLMRPFTTGRLPLYHFDVYRLCGAEELFDIGYDEFMFSEGVSLVEWAEKAGDLLGEDFLHVKILYDEEDAESRTITLTACGDRFAARMPRIGERTARLQAR